MRKDGSFGIFTPDIGSTIIGKGNTMAEVKANFENSFRGIIRFCEEDGIPVPDDLRHHIRIQIRHALFPELLRLPQYDQISQFGGHQPFTDAPI